MAQRDEKLNFTYRCSMAQRDEKYELYLPLFNGTAGWKVELYVYRCSMAQRNEKLNFTYRCSMAQRNEK